MTPWHRHRLVSTQPTKLAKIASLLILCVLGAPASSRATTILYEIDNLPDVNLGEDLWRYTYFVSAFEVGSGLSILFDYQAYTSLESPPPSVNADWDVLVFQPDAELPDDGVYDAYALTSTPSVADPFTVSFVWLGSGPPGAQPFIVYNASFETIEVGTTALVPEPGTALLLLLGLVLCGPASSRKRSTSEGVCHSSREPPSD